MIWKLGVQQRVRMFLRLAAHDRVLTNHSRWRRNMADSHGCVRCNGARKMPFMLLEIATFQERYECIYWTRQIQKKSLLNLKGWLA